MTTCSSWTLDFSRWLWTHRKCKRQSVWWSLFEIWRPPRGAPWSRLQRSKTWRCDRNSMDSILHGTTSRHEDTTAAHQICKHGSFQRRRVRRIQPERRWCARLPASSNYAPSGFEARRIGGGYESLLSLSNEGAGEPTGPLKRQKKRSLRRLWKQKLLNKTWTVWAPFHSPRRGSCLIILVITR